MNKLYISIGQPIQLILIEENKKPMGWFSLETINKYFNNKKDLESITFFNKFNKEEIKLIKQIIKLYGGF